MSVEQLRLPDFIEPTPVEVAWVIVVDFREKEPFILVAQRNTNNGSVSYSFPGGKVESGEYPEGGALREALEETGLKLDPELLSASKTPLFFHFLGIFYKALPYFAFIDEAEGVLEDKEPDKLKRWQWLPLSSVVYFPWQGLMPDVILKGFWLDVIKETEALEKDKVDEEI